MRQPFIASLRTHFALIALLISTFVIYAPSLGGGFVLDDGPFIKDNPYIRDASHITRFFSKGVWENSAVEVNSEPLYRPMSQVPMLLNHAIWGSNPVGYHLFAVLLHLVNACLAYLLIRKLLAGSITAATIGAAIFALHPSRVESVAWISGGVDPLVSAFLLGALLAHLSFVNAARNGKEWRYLALSVLFFQLALWSKEAAIAFPLIAVAYSLIYKKKIHWPSVFLHSGVVFAYLVSRYLVLGETGKWGLIDLSHVSRPIDFALGYSELLVFPAQIPFYLQPPEHSVSSVLGILAAVVIFAMAGFSWQAFDQNRKRVLAFSLSWVVIFLWPAVLLAFFTEGYYAARLLYVPSIGIAVFAAALYGHLRETYPNSRVPLLASCILLVSYYGFCTWRGIPSWHDEETIYGKIARLAPESDGAFNGLGRVYFSQGNYAAAEKNFLLALQKAKAPNNRLNALVTLGTIQGMSNNFAQSERYLKDALEINPENSEAWAGLGNLAWLQSQPYQAISFYEKALAFRPGNYEAAMNLAMAYEKVGQLERGALIRRQATPIHP